MGIKVCTSGWISVKSCAEDVDEMWVTIYLVLALSESAGQNRFTSDAPVDESKYPLLIC
jgi:hypothetical protein